MGSSPHTRGAPPADGDVEPIFRIIPAYAGSTQRCQHRLQGTKDHPRIRGEHRQHRRRPERGRGSSPHTRGALNEIWVGDGGGGIIPAYAGSTSRKDIDLAWRADHPRIRGEHRLSGLYTGDGQGSSPHTRGALAHPPDARHGKRIIPAYAGSTAGASSRRQPRGDHPRIRGEHLNERAARQRRKGSSPHTRGALAADRRQEAPKRIIPAYAGSTRGTATARGLRSDHPRIRGEHVRVDELVAESLGSSPHTRGAPPQRREARFSDGIIPAYAGSTAACPEL